MADSIHLAEHFTFLELCHTNTGRVNTPNTSYSPIYIMSNLCKMAFILESFRLVINNDAWLHSRDNDIKDIPIHVNSCFRTREVNLAVGGSIASMHLVGLAFDISVPGMDSDMIRKTFTDSSAVSQAIRKCSLRFHSSYSISNRSAHFEFRHLEDLAQPNFPSETVTSAEGDGENVFPICGDSLK